MTPTSKFDFPTVAEINEIVEITNPALRNLRITDAYYRLNRAMAEFTGKQNLTWCGFAVWASKTAGEYIRQDEVPALIEDWINGALAQVGAVKAVLARVPHLDPEAFLREFAAEVIGDVSAAIGTGNQAVFNDVARPFAQLLTFWTTYQGLIPDADKTVLLESLRGGEPVDAMYQAFSAMFDAAQAPGTRAAAQAMCHANALIGCVEQTRVQPYIAQSLNAPVADLFMQKIDGHLPPLVADALKDLLKPLAEALEDIFQDLSTKWLMKLTLPDGSLRLGEPVPPLNGILYPEVLAALEAVQPLDTYTTLQALDAAQSAAEDWVSYAQRMRYIAVLFRSRQQAADLWSAPFTPAQVAAFEAGEMPQGPL